MRVRKTPLRKCVACQEMKPKKELIRVVRTPQGETLLDITGKQSGRGAYVCGKLECFTLAKKSKAFDRALAITIDPDIYDKLANEFVRNERNEANEP